MNAIVVYNSKTGFSEKYAKWIAEDLNIQAVPFKQALKTLDNYDLIIFGGGVMAGMINGMNKLKATLAFTSKKIILFATGATQQGSTETIKQFKNTNLTEDEQKTISFYYFQGGINFKGMSFLPKMMLKMMKNMLEKKSVKTEEEENMLKTFASSEDHSNREWIEPLVNEAKSIINK